MNLIQLSILCIYSSTAISMDFVLVKVIIAYANSFTTFIHCKSLYSITII